MSVITAPYFAFCVEMGGSKVLTKREHIFAIASLKLVGKSNREITIITGMALHTLQNWTKKTKEGGYEGPSLHKKLHVCSKRTNEDSPRSNGKGTTSNCKGTQEDVPTTSPKSLH